MQKFIKHCCQNNALYNSHQFSFIRLNTYIALKHSKQNKFQQHVRTLFLYYHYF